MGVRQVLGRYGEDAAAQFLRDEGYTVLARNWRCRVGEIDIVARDGDTLVVCEVKTRRGLAFGSPLEAVTASKLARLSRLALEYRRSSDLPPGPIRIDLVSVLLGVEATARIELVRGVG